MADLWTRADVDRVWGGDSAGNVKNMDSLAKDLGQPVETYGLNWLVVGRRFLIALLFFGFGIYMLHIFDIRVISEMVLGALGWTVLSMLALMWIVYAAWKVPKITIFERGIEIVKRSSNERWLWNEISRVEGFIMEAKFWFVFSLWHRGEYRCYVGSRCVLRITFLTRRYNTLLGKLCEGCSEARLAYVIEQLRRRVTVFLDDIRVNYEGISTKYARLDWEAVDSARIQFPYVLVYKIGHKQAVHFAVTNFINAMLLVMMVERVQSQSD